MHKLFHKAFVQNAGYGPEMDTFLILKVPQYYITLSRRYGCSFILIIFSKLKIRPFFCS